MESYKSKPVIFILVFYFLCFFVRGIEYLLFRTDQSMIGEAMIHKLIGILFLAIALKLLHYKWHDIGFVKNDIGMKTLLGLVFLLLLILLK